MLLFGKLLLVPVVFGGFVTLRVKGAGAYFKSEWTLSLISELGIRMLLKEAVNK